MGWEIKETHPHACQHPRLWFGFSKYAVQGNTWRCDKCNQLWEIKYSPLEYRLKWRWTGDKER